MPKTEEIEIEVEDVVCVRYEQRNERGRIELKTEVLDSTADLPPGAIINAVPVTRYTVRRVENGEREVKLATDYSPERGLILKLAEHQRKVAVATGRKVTVRVRRRDQAEIVEVYEARPSMQPAADSVFA